MDKTERMMALIALIFILTLIYVGGAALFYSVSGQPIDAQFYKDIFIAAFSGIIVFAGVLGIIYAIALLIGIILGDTEKVIE